MTPRQIELARHALPEDIETGACEACETVVPFEDLVSHVDVYLCRKCSDAWRAEFDVCLHRWEPHRAYGEEGRYCTRCAGFVADEMAASLFPLICDGWVDVEEIAAGALAWSIRWDRREGGRHG